MNEVDLSGILTSANSPLDLIDELNQALEILGNRL